MTLDSSMRHFTFQFKPALKRLSLAVSLAISGNVLSSVVYAAPTQQYHIQAGSLLQSLQQVALQNKVSLLIHSGKVADYRAASLQGQYQLDEAFAVLLTNTPFQMMKSSAGYVLVEKQEQSNLTTTTTTDKSLQDSNQLYQMPTIVLQAQTEDTAKFGQSVLNQKSIDRYQANNVAQLLDTMPSVGAAGSPRPGGQNLNILGMGGVEDVPISLDDSVKSFDKYRQGSVFVEPELLKKLTVDKGPHNVEVGNGGFGGKVTLETKDATDLLRDGRNTGAFLKYSRFSNNAQDTYTAAVYGKTENKLVDGLFLYTKRDSGNVQRPDGSKFLYSAQEQDSYMAKLNFYPSESQKITLNALQSGHKGWEPFAAMRDMDAVPSDKDIEKYGYDLAWKRRLVLRDQQDNSYSLHYELRPEQNPLVNLKASVSYSKTKQHDQRLPEVNGSSSLLGNESWVDYSNTAVKLSNISDIDTRYGSHKVKVGLQYQKMQQESVMYDKGNSGKAEYNYGYYEPHYMPAGDQQMYSAFVEDQYQWNNLTITPSLRYDNVTNKGYGNQAPRFNDLSAGHDYSEKTYTGWSPRLALAWQPVEYMTWFANISKTWRAPRLDEQYYVQSKATTLPATSLYLKPEKMLAFRLGTEMNFAQLLSDEDQLQLRLTHYRQQGSDEIFRHRSVFCKEQADLLAQGQEAGVAVCNGNFKPGFYRNIGDYTTKAYEVELFYNQPLFFAGLTYSYIRGQRDHSPINPWFDQKTWIAEIPPRKATATLGLNVPEYDLSMGWRGIFVDAQNRSIIDTDKSAASFALPKTKGYALHSIFVDWQPIGDKGPQVNFSIDNLLNTDYKMYLGEYMTGTGRDFKLSISQRF